MDVTLVDQGGRSLSCTGCIDKFDQDTTFDFGSNHAAASIPSGSSPGGSTPSPPTDSGDSSTPAPAPTPSSCFSATTTVDVRDKGKVAMRDFQVNDWVATMAPGVYQPVYAMAHYDPHTAAAFLRISTENDDHTEPLEITGGHLVFLEGRECPVTASSIRVGMALQTRHLSSSVIVTDITTIYRQGLYAPLTADGTIVADGIAASNYVALQRNTDSEFVRVGGQDLPFLSQDTVLHMALSTLRIWCTWIQGCPAIGPRGYHPFVDWAIELVHWTELQSPTVQWVVFSLCLVAMLVFYVVEKVCWNFMCLVAIAFAAACCVYKRQKAILLPRSLLAKE